MFPADDADFDLDLGEQLGETLREIAAEFGVRPGVVPLPRSAPEGRRRRMRSAVRCSWAANSRALKRKGPALRRERGQVRSPTFSRPMPAGSVSR